MGKVWTVYKKTTLKNGVRIITEPLDYLRSVSLGIWVNTGSRDEEIKENGISHFIEHMLFRGTRNRSSLQLAKELDAIGGLSNAFTGKESTCIHARVLDKHFKLLSDIFSDIFLNSIFDPDDVERERQVILQEINMVEDTPDDNIHVLFNRLIWNDHPIGLSILGSTDSVADIGKEMIHKYINNHYSPERIILAAAGNVDHQSMLSCYAPFFESISGENSSNINRSVPRSNTDISIHYKEMEQVHICLGGEGPSLTNDRRFACSLLNTILGGNMSSRLFQEIREKRGLAYSVYSFTSSYVDTGLFGVYVATDSKNVNPVIETIQKEIKKISRGEILESELNEAKEHLAGGIYLSSESVDNRMMRLAKNEFLFGRYVSFDELTTRLEKVKIDEVVEIACDIFKDNNVSLVTLGPFKQENLDMGNLQFN